MICRTVGRVGQQESTDRENLGLDELNDDREEETDSSHRPKDVALMPL